MENDFNIGKFTQFARCSVCGTQRCSPRIPEWREGCIAYRDFISLYFTDKYVAFWGGPFSNFYPCKIHYSGDKKFKSPAADFHCSEQMFMWLKAIYFHDQEIADEILKVKTPKEAKALGRQVKNFSDDLWNEFKELAMFDAVYYKFKQNERLRNYLLSPAFDGLKFVEGSPIDKIWGVGVNWCDPKIADEKNWKGQNLLGKTLDDVRKLLLEENEDTR